MAGLDSGVDVAGKTGTGEVSDFWFVGFTPRIVVAVRVGMDNNFRQPCQKKDVQKVN